MKLKVCLPMVCLLFAVFSPEASAQFNRTAVSINGSDLNPCTVASPCRSFTRAISQTNAGGEVIALDSGGYGPFTVDRSASVMAAPGVYAGITATGGLDGIDVSATATSKVVLRNLFVNGLQTGNAGVAVTGLVANANVEHLVIDGFNQYGIIAFSNVRISDTTVRNSGEGIWIDNAGGPVQATIERVFVTDMAGGHPLFPGSGIIVHRNTNVTVRDSVVTVANIAFGATYNGILNLENCLATESTVGVRSQDNAMVRISNTVVTNNATGVSAASTIQTWQNNKVAGNTTNISGALTAIGLN